MEFVVAADFEDVHEKRQYAFSRKVASAVVNDSWNIIELPPQVCPIALIRCESYE